MDDFAMLGGDFGFKPLGKSAPMTPGTAAADSPAASNLRRDDLLFDDVFGGAARSGFDYDSAFRGPSRSSSSSKYSSVPGHDKPVYDDEFFGGGLKAPAGSSAAKYDDVFDSFSSSPMRGKDQGSDQFGDFVGNLGKAVPNKPKKVEQDTPAFDDLLPGFGAAAGGSSIRRPTSDSNRSQKSSPNLTKQASNVMEDPFVVLESTSNPASSSGLFMDPMGEFNKFSSSGNTKPGSSSGSGSVFDDLDPFDNLGKHMPRASSDFNHRGNDGSPIGASPVGKEQTSNFSADSFENHSQKKAPVDSFQEPNRFDQMSNTSSDFHRSGGQAVSPPSYASAMANEMDSHIGTSPRHEENLGTSGDVWLTVSEVPLFTQPTSAPPPSRPPPPRPTRVSKSERRSFGSTSSRNKSNEFSSFGKSSESSYSPKAAHNTATSPVTSQMDELENFVMGWNQNNVNEDFLSGEEVKSSPDAAAKKEAMDRAEAEFRHAKERRGKEHHKTARSRESINMDKNEKIMQDAQEKELRERLDHERQQKEREEEEREQRRLEKEREQKKLEKAREMEREREKARQAVERATREARERAAAEARLRAERAAAEKAQNEAREREKAAVHRALAEARERAAAEAKERAEKAAAEAREREARASASRAEADSRSRAERASAERAAEAAAKVHKQNNDDDLETFFSMGSSRPSSAPNSSDPLFDTDTQKRGGPAVARTTSVGASSNIRKTSSSTNIDDLSSIFGAAPSSGSFPDIEGETEERRRARLERHQRTQERAAKALAEKNQRDLQVQREQAERHRIAETLDVEIKRWAAGKEGNIRALLSTLQYVLWPECGWQPVSLTDMIPAASVKKIYRKATLRIHPDKVQQKGANLQQKYIAEKVFDLLQEAWKKFNSEELF